MGDSYSKFTPGFKPSDDTCPQTEEYYDSILDAYKSAVEYIKSDTKRRYCIVGPGNWVVFWCTDEKAKLSVEQGNENIILCYHDDLDITWPENLDPSKITAGLAD